MKRTGLTTRFALATLALGTFMWIAPATVSAQNWPAQNQNTDDPSRQQLAAFAQFLNDHPEIAEQLQKNPALIDNKDFVQGHPALQQFMLGHPELRKDFEKNPVAFMRDEDRYRWDNQQGGHGYQGVRFEELFSMDQFLNAHPEIAQQLKQNPSLLDDQKYLAEHPDLQQFLSQHPGMREACDRNPQAFLQAVARFENTDEITRRELINMDHFLDEHPEIAQELQKDPGLIDKPDFVRNHPALQQFLAQHPGVKEAFERNPDLFMHDEDRFDHHQQYALNSDMNRGELASFHDFLEGHGTIARDLEKNPSLASNSGYLQDHIELQAYLSAHPQASEQLHENPQTFINSSESFDATAQNGMKTTPKTTTTPDPLKK
jgi:phage-related protein